MMSRNPGRGCGTKKADSFYLEGLDMSEEGSGPLWAFTGLFGNGLGEHLSLKFPARQMTIVNPAAIIATGEMVYGDRSNDPEYDIDLSPVERAAYVDLLERTRHIGIGDHVGAKFYSAFSFAKECGTVGPSRKINKETAKLIAPIIAAQGPIPILFTHSRVPLLTSMEQRERIAELLFGSELITGLDPTRRYDACWDYGDWGQYAIKGQWNGVDNPPHSMVDVLWAVDRIDKDWIHRMNDSRWVAVRDFLAEVPFVEQAFGLSWLTQVTYTLPKDGKDKAASAVQKAIPGIDILDLDVLDEAGYAPEIEYA